MTTRGPADLPAEMRPERYIEKVNLATGETLGEPVLPRQLLVHSHRDYHFADVQARRMMSRIIKETGDEDKARARMKEMRAFGRRTSKVLARMVGSRDPERVAKALFGLKDRDYYFRYKKPQISREDIEQRYHQLRAEAEAQLDKPRDAGGGPRASFRRR